MIKQALSFYESERHMIQLSVSDFRFDDDQTDKIDSELIDRVIVDFLSKQIRFQELYKSDGLTIDFVNRVFFSVHEYYEQVCLKYPVVHLDLVKMFSTITEFYNCDYVQFYEMLIATGKTMLIGELAKTNGDELKAVLNRKRRKQIETTSVIVHRLPI